ncbi:MAG: hypothetical protein J7M17_00500 [Anaerolineae bacterium]|nr:hypothetical protein [Anaerolineae bacterium]
MQDIKEMPYQVVVEKVKHWPAVHRLALVQEILRTLSRDASIPSPRKKTLEQALGLLATTEPAPDDATIHQWLRERREEKYG